MDKTSLTLDSLILLTLCADFSSMIQEPLSIDEWHLLRKKMKATNYKRPSSLFNMSLEGLILIYDLDEYLAKKIVNRIKLIPNLLNTIKYLEEQGIHIITKYDPEYPTNSFVSLKKRAPLILYFIGNIHLLKTKMVSITGPKDVDRNMKRWINTLTDKMLDSSLTLITGQNRGTEDIAVTSYLRKGGDVVLFANNHLSQIATNYQKHLRNSHLLLVSATDPFSTFNVTNAIDCNSYIYGLCQEMMIVACHINNGDTWFSAMQNFHYQWADVHCISDFLYPGNVRLIELGAHPLSMHDLENDHSLLTILEQNKKDEVQDSTSVDQLSIYDFIN